MRSFSLLVALGLGGSAFAATRELSESTVPRLGAHLPQGNDAVEHLYGELGTWREIKDLSYTVNYYEIKPPLAEHPFDKGALLRIARDRHTTALDANRILLTDANRDGELDATSGGAAFMEHNAIGDGGDRKGWPFHQFWFDDNDFAQSLARAYARPLPWGLFDPGRPLRWSPVAGRPNYTPYPSAHKYVDQLALNGMHRLNTKNLPAALRDFRDAVTLLQAKYDDAEGRYHYPGLTSFYHLGLTKILAEWLLREARLSRGERAEILQHARSQHALLLTHQVRHRVSGARLGWKSGLKPTDLINTETTSASALALGAGALWTLEPEDFVANDYRLPEGRYVAEIEARPKSGPQATFFLRVRQATGTLRVQRFEVEGTPGQTKWQRFSIPFAQRRGRVPLKFDVGETANEAIEFGPLRIFAAK